MSAEKKVILVAKDYRGLSEELQDAFVQSPQHEFFEVVLADTTEEALKVIQEQSPVLVVSGLIGIDWKRLAKEVKDPAKIVIWSTEYDEGVGKQGIETLDFDISMMGGFVEQIALRANRVARAETFRTETTAVLSE